MGYNDNGREYRPEDGQRKCLYGEGEPEQQRKSKRRQYGTKRNVVTNHENQQEDRQANHSGQWLQPDHCSQRSRNAFSAFEPGKNWKHVSQNGQE